MKRFIAQYLLYVYLTFIKDDDDFEIYKKWAVPFLKKLKFTYNVYIWIASILFFPIFVIDMQAEKLAKKFNIKD